jgi:hypothetical protein
MASLFKSLSEDMEKIAQVVEEGTKIIMGTSSHMGEQSANNIAPGQTADAGLYDGDELYDDEDMESPLMGMADSVLSDIMSSQVSQASLCVLFRSGIPLTYPELNQ